MDPAQDKRNKREMEKKMREHVDMIGYELDAHYRIPSRCPCGGRSIDEVSSKPKYPTYYDTFHVGRYFTCKEFENNGHHFRQPWAICVQEEIQWLRKRTNWMADEIDELKQLMSHRP